MHVCTPGRGPGRPRRVRARRLRRLQGVCGPVLATATAVAMAAGSRASTGLIVGSSFVVARLARQPVRRHMAQLPMMRHMTAALGTLLAVAALALWAPPSALVVALLVAVSMAGTLLV